MDTNNAVKTESDNNVNEIVSGDTSDEIGAQSQVTVVANTIKSDPDVKDPVTDAEMNVHHLQEKSSISVQAVGNDTCQSNKPKETIEIVNINLKAEEFSTIDPVLDLAAEREKLSKKNRERETADVAKKSPDEEIVDLPDDFFDDFSNTDFMAGLNVVDSWKPDPDDKEDIETESSQKVVQKKGYRAEFGKRVAYRGRRRSREKRSASREYRNRVILRPKYRYGRLKRSAREIRNRRSQSNESEHLPDVAENGKVGSRRDPENSKRNIKQDKATMKQEKAAREIAEKLKVVDTGLVPPGMEMEVVLPEDHVPNKPQRGTKRKLNKSSDEWHSSRSSFSISPQPNRSRSPLPLSPIRLHDHIRRERRSRSRNIRNNSRSPPMYFPRKWSRSPSHSRRWRYSPERMRPEHLRERHLQRDYSISPPRRRSISLSSCDLEMEFNQRHRNRRPSPSSSLASGSLEAYRVYSRASSVRKRSPFMMELERKFRQESEERRANQYRRVKPRELMSCPISYETIAHMLPSQGQMQFQQQGPAMFPQPVEFPPGVGPPPEGFFTSPGPPGAMMFNPVMCPAPQDLVSQGHVPQGPMHQGPMHQGPIPQGNLNMCPMPQIYMQQGQIPLPPGTTPVGMLPQDHMLQSPMSQDHIHQGPIQPDTMHQGPMPQGPMLPIPMHQGPMPQGPMPQGPMHQGPMHQGPMPQGPMHQGPMLLVPMHQGPMPQGPMLQGPMPQGAMLPVPMHQGPMPQGAMLPVPMHQEPAPESSVYRGLLRPVPEMVPPPKNYQATMISIDLTGPSTSPVPVPTPSAKKHIPQPASKGDKSRRDKRNLHQIPKSSSKDGQLEPKITQLFADKKISLSDFLTVSAKKLDSKSQNPATIENKVKVISRCQDALMNLENVECQRTPPCLRLNTCISAVHDQAIATANAKYRSPLRRTPVVRFKYTTPVPKSPDVSPKVFALRRALNILPSAKVSPVKKPLLPVRVVSSSVVKQPELVATREMSVQTDPITCALCDVRDSIEFRNVGLQVAPPAGVSEGTQVIQGELPTRGHIQNEHISMSHMTPAQLLSFASQQGHGPPSDNYPSQSSSTMDNRQGFNQNRGSFNPTASQQGHGPPSDNYPSQSSSTMDNRPGFNQNRGSFNPTASQQGHGPPSDNYPSQSSSTMDNRPGFNQNRGSFNPIASQQGHGPPSDNYPSQSSSTMDNRPGFNQNRGSFNPTFNKLQSQVMSQPIISFDNQNTRFGGNQSFGKQIESFKKQDQSFGTQNQSFGTQSQAFQSWEKQRPLFENVSSFSTNPNQFKNESQNKPVQHDNRNMPTQFGMSPNKERSTGDMNFTSFIDNDSNRMPSDEQFKMRDSNSQGSSQINNTQSWRNPDPIGNSSQFKSAKPFINRNFRNRNK